MRSLTSLFLIMALSTTLIGCEVPQIAPPGHVIGSPLEGTPTDCSKWKSEEPSLNLEAPEDCVRAKANNTKLEWYKENEWPYNRGRGETVSSKQRPLVCVAISGGGIRSAAFGIGVLKGLHKTSVTGTNKTLLSYTDIISGTSGGAYAVSWYYTQHPGGTDGDTNLFEEDGFFQTVLQDKASFLGFGAYTASLIGNVVVASPLNLILNGIWGSHTNTNFGRYLYRSNLRNTFQGGASYSLKQLNAKIQSNKMPYFIITTTSRIDENNFHMESLLSNTVFEFTPVHIGNDGFTYVKINDDNDKDGQRAPTLEIEKITAVSGAAPDSSHKVSGSAQRFLSSGFNADYGYYIKNYNDTRPQWRRSLTKLAPFPFYFFTESYNRDLYGSDIYLSDGGHQENLAAYPLIRRQCEQLIIVDGEYDPNYEFESYFKLKHNIERELQVTMALKSTDFCEKTRRNGCRDTDIERIEKILQHNSELPGARGDAESRRPGIPRCCFSGQHPVIKGMIGHFPTLGESDKIEWNQIKVTYIKMAIDENLFKGWAHMSDPKRDAVKRQVGTYAADYFAKATADICDVQYWYPCEFPQFSTIYQSFTPTQFKAYVDLGATMVNNHLKARFDDGSLHLDLCDNFSSKKADECNKIVKQQ